MYQQAIQADLDVFRRANSLMKDSNQTIFNKSFEETFEEQAKQVARKANDEATELVESSKDSKKKKEKDTKYETLPDITKITRNIEKSLPHDIRNSQSLLEKFKDKKKIDEEIFKGNKQQFLQSSNLVGQPLIEPVYDQGQRRATKSQMLAAWEKFAPVITEDLTKKAVRIDIPLINDVQALVLRLHPDRSISASLLGSYVMGELIKQNKDQLDRNLRHHHLSLREFNTYRSELEFNTESGTRKNPKKKQGNKAKEVDLI